MTDWTAAVWPKEPEKNEVTFFGKPYKWGTEDGRLTLVPLPPGAVTLGKWNCCGRLKVL